MGLLDKLRGHQADDKTDGGDQPTFGEKMMGDTGPNAGREWTFGDRWAPSPYRFNRFVQDYRDTAPAREKDPYYRIYFYGKFHEEQSLVFDGRLRFYHVAVLQLVADSKKPVKQSKVPKGWSDVAMVNSADLACRELMRDGYLKDLDASEKLSTLNVADLKTELEFAGLPTKGNKAELVERIVASVPSLAEDLASTIEPCYILSDKGRRVLDDNPWFAERLNGEIWYDIDLVQVALLYRTGKFCNLYDACQDLYTIMGERFLAEGCWVEYADICQSLARLNIEVDPEEACYWAAQTMNAFYQARIYNGWQTVVRQIHERCGLNGSEIVNRMLSALRTIYPIAVDVDKASTVIYAAMH